MEVASGGVNSVVVALIVVALVIILAGTRAAGIGETAASGATSRRATLVRTLLGARVFALDPTVILGDAAGDAAIVVLALVVVTLVVIALVVLPPDLVTLRTEPSRGRRCHHGDCRHGDTGGDGHEYRRRQPAASWTISSHKAPLLSPALVVFCRLLSRKSDVAQYAERRRQDRNIGETKGLRGPTTA